MNLPYDPDDADRALTRRQSAALARAAWHALTHPTANSVPTASRRLLEQAANGEPLSRLAARTVIRLIRDLARDDAETEPAFAFHRRAA